MNGSLSRRIFGRLLITSGLALVAALVVLAMNFRSSAEFVHDRGLSSASEEIAASLSHNAEGRLVENVSEELRERFEEDFFFTVSDERGTAYLSLPPGLTTAYHPFEPEIIDHHQYFEHNYLGEDESYLGVTMRVVIDGQEYWLQLVESIPGWQSIVNNSSQIFTRGAVLVLAAYFLISTLLTRATINMAFAPIDRFAEEAQKITPQQPSIRLNAEGLPSEVTPLVETTNNLLDRLEKALLAQRRFTADAAHELLTPIAIIKADVQALEDKKKAKALLRDVEDITEIVTQLLELSELESDVELPSAEVDLAQIGADALSRMAPLAIKKSISCELKSPKSPVIVHGCTKALLRAVRNLIENAIRHAAGATRLIVEVNSDGTIAVIDDGPGIPPEHRELIFERFRHYPSSEEGGTGLGLAIVARIVAAHGGTLSVSEGLTGRGSRFEMSFPLASQG